MKSKPNKVIIQVTFEWEISRLEWREFTKDFDNEDFNKKIEFSAWDVCYHLNQINRPTLSSYKVISD